MTVPVTSLRTTFVARPRPLPRSSLSAPGAEPENGWFTAINLHDQVHSNPLEVGFSPARRPSVFHKCPNSAVERTSASSSAVYSDRLRGWPKPLTLERYVAWEQECQRAVEEEVMMLLALWEDGVVKADQVVRWADQQIALGDPKSFPTWLIELSLYGPGACWKNPLLQLPQPVSLSFSDRFALRAVSLQLDDSSSVQAFVAWVARAAMGEDLELPDVQLGYEVDHCLNDCSRMDWAIKAVREKLPSLLADMQRRANALMAAAT
jgi:hypothetical protein